MISLAIIYLLLHWIGNLTGAMKPGNIQVSYLNKEQILLINDIISSPSDSPEKNYSIPFQDSPKNVNKKDSSNVYEKSENIQINTQPIRFINDSMKRKSIRLIIFNGYPEMDTTDIKDIDKIIRYLPFKELNKILPTYPIKQKSFFWLYDNWVYLEIIFWCLFGVLANLLFHTAEYLRKKQFETTEIYVQVAKFVYSPFCVIIIYICYNEIRTKGTQYDIQYSVYSLAVSFLLGFFSGRMIDLLNRLKDILLPNKSGKDDDENDDKHIDDTKPPINETASSFDQLGKTYNLSGKQLIEMAINQNQDKMKLANPGIRKIVYGSKMKDNAIIEYADVLLNKGAPENIDKYISGTLSDGKTFQVPTRIIKDISTPRIQVGTGEGIANSNSKNFVGTITCGVVLQNGENRLLTCCHVMSNKLCTGFNGDIDPAQNALLIDNNGNSNSLGIWDYGIINQSLDCAFIQPTNSNDIDSLTEKNLTTNIRKLNNLDTTNHLQVRIFRRKDEKDGFVIFIDPEEEFDYDDGSIKFNNLLVLSSDIDPNNYTPLTEDGDSGSLITDNDGNPIGMVLGANGQFTYGILFTTITSNIKNIVLI